jgi:cytochrome P450
MLFKDPPEHRRLRTLVSAAFTPSAIAAMRPITEKIAGQLLDTVEPAAETNLVEAFTVPLPVYVIATMLGFEADNSDLLAWSMAVADMGEQGMGFAGDAERTMALGSELIQHIEQISEQRRRTPRDDLISGLCAAEDHGDKLDHNELVGMVLLLLAAGNITTRHLIGNAAALLMDHPDQWHRLLSDENLVPSAVEEVLRFAPSIQMSVRRCATDAAFGERQVPAGSTLLAITGAANRDPRHFPDPDTFDIDRNDRRHLSFAFGIHTCLGAALARMEADVALQAMLRRFPHMTSGATPRQQRSGIGVGGFDHLPVILGGQ